MRKSFKHILLAGLTIASTAMAMNAQTLTQDWKVTEGLPAATDARWGIGFDGKVFVNDMTAQKSHRSTAQTRTLLRLERPAYALLLIPKATFSLPTSGNGAAK